jgi:hypothetical protein
MNKCYYCNNSQRGCAECRKQTDTRQQQIQAWVNGSWDDVEEDETLDAVYYGSRAGGKMLALQEQVYREMLHAEAQQPMLLIHDELTTFADPKHVEDMSKLSIDSIRKTMDDIEAKYPRVHRSVDLG